MNVDLKKRIMKCMVWNLSLYAAETLTLIRIDRRMEKNGEDQLA